jgi:hypothetical protein
MGAAICLLLTAVAVLIGGLLFVRQKIKQKEIAILSAEELEQTIHTDSTPGM